MPEDDGGSLVWKCPSPTDLTTVRLIAHLRRALLAVILLAIALPTVALTGFRLAAARHETSSIAEAAPGTGHLVRAGDVRVFVQEAGPSLGAPVLLVHGTGAWSEIWRRTLDTLGAAGYHAVAIDLPPFGYSERPTSADYGDVAQARRILGVMDSLGLQRVTLVAHSFGARPAMQPYFTDGARIAQLVLVDAALGLDTTTVRAAWPVRAVLAAPPLRSALVSATLTNRMMTGRLMRGLVADKNSVTDERIAMLQRPFVREGTTVSFGEWLRPFVVTDERSLARERDRYRAVRAPTLVLWGDADSITPLAQGREIAGLIPGADWVVLRGVGHIPAIEATDQFDVELLRWLGRTTGERAGRADTSVPAP